MKGFIRIPSNASLPLLGCIAFGLIDRGTNLIQIRPISGCNINCIFCSVDEGEKSKTRVTRYLVELDYLIEWFKDVVNFKGKRKIEAHIDGTGEPTLYPWFVDLVHEISDIEGVDVISVQTNGTTLTEEKIEELSEAGLSRINLSLNAMDSFIAKKLAGVNWYDVNKIIEIAKSIENSKIDLLIAPVWVPTLNDEEILKIIEFTKNLAKKEKKWPILGIQKYEAHKYGRKPKGVKEISWWKFYKELEELEKKFKVKLKLGPHDFGIHKRRILPRIFQKGEKVRVKILAPGWMRGEMIGVSKNTCITVVNCNAKVGDLVNVIILENKHNLYIAKQVTR